MGATSSGLSAKLKFSRRPGRVRHGKASDLSPRRKSNDQPARGPAGSEYRVWPAALWSVHVHRQQKRLSALINSKSHRRKKAAPRRPFVGISSESGQAEVEFALL